MSIAGTGGTGGSDGGQAGQGSPHDPQDPQQPMHPEQPEPPAQPWQRPPAQGTAPDATHVAGTPHAPSAPGAPGPSSPYGVPPSAAPTTRVGPISPGSPGDPGSSIDPSTPSGHTDYSGPGGPTTPSGPGDPGSGPAQQPSRKRSWALIGVALGCIVILLLAIGGGLLFLVLNQLGDREQSAASGTASNAEVQSETDGPVDPTSLSTDPADSQFEGIAVYEDPPGDADDLRAVLANNPLTAGSLPDVSSCDLPATPVEQSTEELQAVLDASASCLNSVWASAMSDRGLPWEPPTVEVYTYPDVPNSTCEADTFEPDYPRVCNLNNVIYWPVGYGVGASQDDPELVPGAYLWDLAAVYMSPVAWQSSTIVYYGTLLDKIEADQEQADEVWRRHSLQMQCLGAAASMQQPAEARPAPELRDELMDESYWDPDEGSRPIAPASRARWLTAGFESDGDLGVCNTWVAPTEQVA